MSDTSGHGGPRRFFHTYLLPVSAAQASLEPVCNPTYCIRKSHLDRSGNDDEYGEKMEGKQQASSGAMAARNTSQYFDDVIRV